MSFQRRLQPMVRVDLVPMIDVVFQLVIFFMLSSTLVARTGIQLDLPDAAYAEEAVTPNLVLSVVSRDEIYFAGEKVTLDELDELLGSSMPDDGDRSIIVEADEAIPYGTMIAILDVLQANGVRGANLVAERDDTQ